MINLSPVCPVCDSRARYDITNDKWVHTNLKCPLHELPWHKIEEVRRWAESRGLT